MTKIQALEESVSALQEEMALHSAGDAELDKSGLVDQATTSIILLRLSSALVTYGGVRWTPFRLQVRGWKLMYKLGWQSTVDSKI